MATPSPRDARPVAAPLHLQLRASTATAHARLDAGFAGGFGDARGYAAYLGGMAAFLDAAIAAIGAEAWLVEARGALARDLARPEPALPAATARDPARVAGWRYVVAGATLGARVLLRDARALDEHASTAFLSTFSGGDAWPRCLVLLRDAGFDADARARACEAAQDAFDVAEAALHQARSLAHAA